MKILLVYPRFPITFWSFKYALKFVAKKASNPPLGLLTIAAMLPPKWEKRLVDVNVEVLREKQILWADYVFISAISVQQESALEIIERCKILGKKIVAGGPLFTGEPASFPDVDHLILNEGEITLKAFLQDLEQGCPKREYSTPAYADLSETPPPDYSLAKISKYGQMSLQFSRGCPYNCDFCEITSLLSLRIARA